MITDRANFQKDIENIEQIPIVNTLLDVICRTTNMGFAAIARITEDIWLACSVRDEIDFGLKPGDELEIQTTICTEVRQSNKAVIINHVSKDPDFVTHPTPALYGFESYISVPIIRPDGSIFGTLCAIDPEPRDIKTPAIIGMFELFANLISLHLQEIERMGEVENQLLKEQAFNIVLENKIRERTLQLEENNAALIRSNNELQSFNYISSHDLQEPLRKIQTYVTILHEKEADRLSPQGRDQFERLRNAAERMQILIEDLLSYSQTAMDERKFRIADLDAILLEVMEDLSEEIVLRKAEVTFDTLGDGNVISFQFRQLLYNLISNALKFSFADRPIKIHISSSIVDGAYLNVPSHLKDQQYRRLVVSDNGIGFEQQYGTKIFELFQRLHHKTEFSGTGIGLAIVKKIVDNHTGFIEAKGIKKEGAEFTIYIPHNT